MNIWDEIAYRYESWFETPLGERADRAERKALLSLLEDFGGGYALEVGIGTGHFGCLLAQKFDLVGLDLSGGMLKVAGERCGDDLLGLVRGDALKLPFKDGIFDLVYSITVLEFLDDPWVAIDEMFRVTKESGGVLLGVLNRRSSWARKKKPGTIYEKAHYFELRELLPELRSRGRTVWTSAVFFPPVEIWSRFSGLIEPLGKLLCRDRGALLFFLTIKGK